MRAQFLTIELHLRSIVVGGFVHCAHGGAVDMAPARRIVLVFADVDEGNLDGSDEIVLFREVVVVPHFENQVLRLVGHSCPDHQGLVPFRVQTSHSVSLDLVP